MSDEKNVFDFHGLSDDEELERPARERAPRYRRSLSEPSRRERTPERGEISGERSARPGAAEGAARAYAGARGDACVQAVPAQPAQAELAPCGPVAHGRRRARSAAPPSGSAERPAARARAYKGGTPRGRAAREEEPLWPGVRHIHRRTGRAHNSRLHRALVLPGPPTSPRGREQGMPRSSPSSRTRSTGPARWRGPSLWVRRRLRTAKSLWKSSACPSYGENPLEWREDEGYSADNMVYMVSAGGKDICRVTLDEMTENGDAGLVSPICRSPA